MMPSLAQVLVWVIVGLIVRQAIVRRNAWRR